MSVLSSFPAMPNRIAIACEYLHYLGPDGDERSNIEAQLSPLKRPEAEDGTSSGSTIATAVLSEMIALKMLVGAPDGRYRLADDIRTLSSNDAEWSNLLRPILLRRLLFPEYASEFKQEEVHEAMAWLLCQSPYEPMARSGAGGVHVERIEHQLGENDPLRNWIGNNSKYQNLLYWARYFGLAEWIKSGNEVVVIPDPTVAVERNLGVIFNDSPEIPIGEFCARLQALCPVFEGGSARTAVESRMKAECRTPLGDISLSTSFALRRLKLRKVVSFKSDSDAVMLVLNYGRKSEAISHVCFHPGEKN